MKFIGLLCLLIGSVELWAQDVNIYTITLKEQQDSSLLKDHGIWVNNTFLLSDHDGRVIIKTLQSSVHIIIEGEAMDTTLNIPGDHTLFCNQTHELDIFEVHHEEDHHAHIHEEVNHSDIGEALEKHQEITLINTGPQVKKPMYLIFTGNDLLITQRNTRLNGQDWGMDHAPEMDFSNLESLEYLGDVTRFQYTMKPGGAVVTQGNPAAFHQDLGLKLSSTYSSNPNGIQGALNLSSGFKKGPFEHFAWEARGSGLYLANAYSPTYPLSNTGRNGYNYGGSIFFHLHQLKINFHYDLFQNKIGLPAFAHVGNLTDLQKAYQRGNPENPLDQGFEINNFYQDILHETSNIEIKYNPKKNHMILFNASRQFDQRKEFDEDIEPELDLRLTSYVLNATWKNYQNKGVFLIGAEYIYKRNTYVGRYFIPFYKDHETSLFSYKEWQGKSHDFRLGGRMRINQQYSYPSALNFKRTSLFNISYALGFDHEFHTEKSQLRTNLSYQSYAPNLIQLYSGGIHHGAQAYEEGNLDLNNQELILLKSEHEIQVSKTFDITYGAQAGYFFNTINLRPQGKSILTISGAYPIWKYENESAYLYGFKLKYNYEIVSNFHWSGQGQVLISKSRSGAYFPFTPPIQSSQEVRYKWSFLKRNELQWSLQWQYFGNAWEPTVLNEFRLTTHDYSLFQIGMQYKYLLKKGGVLLWNIQVHNLFNTSYRNNLNRLHPFALEIGRNIQINIKIEI